MIKIARAKNGKGKAGWSGLWADMFESDCSGSEDDELDKDEAEFSCPAKEKHAKADGENSAAKRGGGVETPPSVRKGKDKGKGGKSGPKRPQG